MEHLESQLVADRLSTHRNNLLSALRLSVQTIVDQACFSVIDDDCEAYQQLCVALEHIFMFGYKGPALKGLISGNGDRPRHYWYVIEHCTRRSSAFETVRHMDGIKSRLGRCRAWVMTGLVQKSLAQDLKKILSVRKCIRECYDEGAILRLEASQMVSGLLVALEAVDFSLCLRGNPRLDCQVTAVINYSLFMHAKRSFAGQLSDEDELRRARIPFDGPAVSQTSDSTGEADEIDGGVGLDLPVVSLPQPDESVLARQASAPASLSGISRSHAPFNSALTLEGSKEFVSLQRQLTDERNQRRYLEDILLQKDEERDRMVQDGEALSSKLREACRETEAERVTMQNIIVELNEKLCAQERALNSLVARYEDREGLANADIRAAIDVLHHRESRDSSTVQISPVRNVKSFFSRIGKSLKADRDGPRLAAQRPGFSSEGDDEELLDMTMEEGMPSATLRRQEAEKDGGDLVRSDTGDQVSQHPGLDTGTKASTRPVEQQSPQDNASTGDQPPPSADSGEASAAAERASQEAAGLPGAGDGTPKIAGASEATPELEGANEATPELEGASEATPDRLELEGASEATPELEGVAVEDGMTERETKAGEVAEADETDGSTELECPLYASAATDDVATSDSPPLMDASAVKRPATRDTETTIGAGSGYELEVSALANKQQEEEEEEEEEEEDEEDDSDDSAGG